MINKAIIAGGGTGGHLYPGLAVAGELRKRNKDIDILFIGTSHGIEARILPHEGYNLKYIEAGGFVNVPIRKKIIALMQMLVSFFKMLLFLKEFEPDVVIGTGGYASFAPVFVASLLSIPTIILEQNAVPGLANKILARLVKKICITYESSIASLPKEKTILTGNPVRELSLKTRKRSVYKLFSLDETKFTILVFGGSAGATAINNAMMESLVHLAQIKDKVQFLHQSGTHDYELVRKTYLGFECRGTVARYIYEMPEAYCIADIVISRAGATTLAEITSLGLPAVLIPYPFAALAHQEANASRIASSGGAIMIRETELNGTILAEEIIRLYSNNAYRENIRTRCLSLGRPDAARKVVEIIFNTVEQ